jgi:hypothetical protein
VPNTTTNIIPQLLAQGLLAMRQNAILPRLVNRAYDDKAGEIGSSIDVPLPSAITAQAVSPGATPPSTADIAPSKVTLSLDKWYEAPFYLTDKEMLEVMRGTIPMQASEAIKSLTNQVESDIFTSFKTNVYGYAGTAGTTPFATDLAAWTAARTVMSKQLAPMGEKRVVLGPDAVGNALLLRAFQDNGFGGGAEALAAGQFARKLGAAWFEDQNVPTHNSNEASGWLVNQVGHAVGNTTVTIDTGTGNPTAGDIFTVAGDTQTYVVKSYAANVITYGPAAKTAFADNAALTFKADHVLNIAFHPECIALATRPFAGMDPMGIGRYLSAVDPVSGLALRLEVTREHKRTRFAYDILYGVGCPRPEFGVRIAG